MNARRSFDPRLAALAQLELFRSCSPDDLAALLPDTDVVTVAPGTVIDRSGTTARQFVGVLDGYVDAFHDDGSTTVVTAGQHFGAVELFGRLAHEATYRALSAVSLVVVHGPRFRADARPLPAVVFRAMMSARRRPTNELTLVG